MAITHSLDQAAGLVRTRWVGRITIEDVCRYWKERLEEAKLEDQRRTMLDVRGCQVGFTGSELALLLRATPTGAQTIPGRMVAVLVDGQVQYGTARQFQVYFADFGTSEVFTSEAEALAWLLA